jgi:hypothetical protein|tara:strand:+ start:3589 stop:3861 length:273 start_codon:yes stop_codon:yes gene_type:complete
MKFRMKGDTYCKHGVSFMIENNGMREKHKLHFNGGQIYDTTKVMIHVSRDGRVAQVPVSEKEVIAVLDKIKAADFEYIEYIGKKPKLIAQ